MAKFILKRLLTILLVLWAVATLTYFMVHVTPGDTASAIIISVYGEEFVTEDIVAAVSRKYDLDRPILVQYLGWLGKAVRFDFGTSYRYNMPVSRVMAARMPNTLRLGFLAFLISSVIGIPLGILSALKQNRFLDHFTRVSSLFVGSFPGFWMGIMLIIVFALRLKLFPTSGMEKPESIVLPAVTLSLGMMASTTRMMRASMLEVLRQDYMVVAKSKGIRPSAVMTRHAFRNALPTVITVLGLQIGHILGGSVLVESIFAWPGLGELFSGAISAKDLPMLEGCVILITFSYAFANLLVDVVYALLDPRVKYQEGR
jgi:peptide/nickel transport system permease protein